MEERHACLRAVLGRGKLTGQEADSDRGCRGCQNVSAVWQLSRHDFLVRFSCPALIDGKPKSPTITVRLIVHFVSEKHEHARSGDGGRASAFPAALITLFAR